MTGNDLDTMFKEDPQGSGRHRLQVWRWSVAAPNADERLDEEATVVVRGCWAYLPSGERTECEEFSIPAKAGWTVGQALVALEKKVRARYIALGTRPRTMWIEGWRWDDGRCEVLYGT